MSSTLDKRLTALERQQVAERAVLDGALVLVPTPERRDEVITILCEAGVCAMPPPATSDYGQRMHAGLRAELRAEGRIGDDGWPLRGSDAHDTVRSTEQ